MKINRTIFHFFKELPPLLYKCVLEIKQKTAISGNTVKKTNLHTFSFLYMAVIGNYLVNSLTLKVSSCKIRKRFI